MTTHRAVSRRPSLLLGVLAGLLGAAAPSPRADAGPPGPEPTGIVRTSLRSATGAPSLGGADQPAGRRLGPLILRDPETVAAIRRTERRGLPPERGENLRLRLEKSRYRLDVLDGDYLLKVYPVAMGPALGPKRVSGDLRTPEGRYRLIPHHPSPAWGPSFYVLYPGPHDVERALGEGLLQQATAGRLRRSLDALQIPAWDSPLGGLVLLHGSKDRSRRDLTMTPWTQGCIALENASLEELLAAFRPEDRPILEIRP